MTKNNARLFKMIKKSLLFILLICINAFCSHAQEIILKGYTTHTDSGRTDTVLAESRLYNADTVLLKHIYYKNGQRGQIISVYYYDEKQQLSRKERTVGDSIYVSSTVFERDKAGNLTKQVIKEDGETAILYHHNELDKRGRITSTIMRMETPGTTPEISTRIDFFYEGNKLIKTDRYMEGEYTETNRTMYDKEGNRVADSTYHSDGTTQSSRSYFDPQNRMIRQEYFEEGKLVSTSYFSWMGRLPLNTTIRYADENKEEVIRYIIERP
jgi:antitoxin component YwqK of YwqJK toxin-antitoxin module